MTGIQRMVWRVCAAVILVFVFSWQLVLANISVVRAVYARHPPRRSGIIAYRVGPSVARPIPVTVLALSITLTPGTITVDVSLDCALLHIHILDAVHPDSVRDQIRRSFEYWIKEVFA